MPARLAATALIALLLLPASALAQGLQSPIGPQVPPPREDPRQSQPAPRVAQEDDFDTAEVLALLGVGILLIVGTFFALRFEMARRSRRRADNRRRDQVKRGHSAAAFKASAGRSASERASDTKRPPPPPRKQHRRKAKRR